VKHNDEMEEPNAHAAAGTGFNAIASPLVEEAIACAVSVRHSSNVESVHELRVALRQLRSLLWAYRPLLDREFEIRQQTLYRSLASAVGATRSWDVLIELLTCAGKADRTLLDSLEQARTRALARSREALANANVSQTLRKALSEASARLNTINVPAPMLSVYGTCRVLAAKKALQKRVARATLAKHSDYAAFHDVRKAAKKVRYLVEFFDPVLAGDRHRDLKLLLRLQKRFGSLNDVVASRVLLEANRISLSGDASIDKALKWLAIEQRRRTRRASRLLQEWMKR